MFRSLRSSLLGSLATLAACSDGTGPTSPVSITFGTKAPAAATPVMGSAGIAGAAGGALEELVITGTNGTLRISDLRVIVNEFELKRVEEEALDCDVEPAPEGCEDFEAGPFFVDVPLTGAPVTVTSEEIPEGSYDEFEFEVDDIEVDEDEGAEAQAIQNLLNTVRQAFADWPNKASMVVVGTFTPTGGNAVSFRAYFEADIEVEFDINPALVVGATGASIDVDLNPSAWFKKADGTVLDLSAFDFPKTGQVIKFELEIEKGFELEID